MFNLLRLSNTHIATLSQSSQFCQCRCMSYDCKGCCSYESSPYPCKISMSASENISFACDGRRRCVEIPTSQGAGRGQWISVLGFECADFVPRSSVVALCNALSTLDKGGLLFPQAYDLDDSRTGLVCGFRTRSGGFVCYSAMRNERYLGNWGLVNLNQR
jgi:hypothetical protein